MQTNSRLNGPIRHSGQTLPGHRSGFRRTRDQGLQTVNVLLGKKVPNRRDRKLSPQRSGLFIARHKHANV